MRHAHPFAAAVLLALLALPAHAASVTFATAEGCPSEATFVRALVGDGGSLAQAAIDEGRIEVRLAAGADGFEGRVRLATQNGASALERTVAGVRCEDVASALRLALVVALEQDLAPALVSGPSAPAPSGSASVDTTAGAAAEEATQAPPEPQARAAGGPWSLGPTFRLAWGRANGAAAEVGSELAYRAHPRVDLRAGALWSLPRDVGGGTEIAVIGGRLGACARMLAFIGPCAAMTAGQHRFRGAAGDADRFWLAAEGGVRAGAKIGRLEAGVLGGASLSLPPRRVIDGRSARAQYQAPPLGGYLGIDVSVLFP